MISIEKCRKIDPGLKHLNDEELTKARDLLYELGQLALESYLANKNVSKNPDRDFT